MIEIPKDWIKLWEKACGCALYRLPSHSIEFNLSAVRECEAHEFIMVLQNRGENKVE